MQRGCRVISTRFPNIASRIACNRREIRATNRSRVRAIFTFSIGVHANDINPTLKRAGPTTAFAFS